MLLWLWGIQRIPSLILRQLEPIDFKLSTETIAVSRKHYRKTAPKSIGHVISLHSCTCHVTTTIQAFMMRIIANTQKPKFLSLSIHTQYNTPKSTIVLITYAKSEGRCDITWYRYSTTTSTLESLLFCSVETRAEAVQVRFEQKKNWTKKSKKKKLIKVEIYRRLAALAGQYKETTPTIDKPLRQRWDWDKERSPVCGERWSFFSDHVTAHPKRSMYILYPGSILGNVNIQGWKEPAAEIALKILVGLAGHMTGGRVCRTCLCLFLIHASNCIFSTSDAHKRSLYS